MRIDLREFVFGRDYHADIRRMSKARFRSIRNSTTIKRYVHGRTQRTTIARNYGQTR